MGDEEDNEGKNGKPGKKERAECRPSCGCAPPSDGSDTEFDRLAEMLQAKIDAIESEVFSATVVRECKYPRNVGRMENPDAFAKVGTVGESIELHLRFDEEGKVAEALFNTDGCGATIASGSMLTQMVKGKTREMLERLTVDDLMASLEGLPPEQKHCAELSMEALRTALKNMG
jgi:NifU-like protein involved in Fe-S cluster formation